LEALQEAVCPGISTRQLDGIANRVIVEEGAVPSFKGYQGFPASMCVSVNEELVHGIPGKRVLQEGDIVSMDLGTIYQGYQGDASVTVGVGQIDDRARRLMDVTFGALWAGIFKAMPGNRLGDMSWAIQEYAETRGYSVVREYVGHGIGQKMHEPPQIPNFGQAGEGPVLKVGMTFALEPMVNEGDYLTEVRGDGWTVVTEDGKLSAHFEHTIAITEDGPEVLTKL
jgi:methionyl aminopeptidase